MESTNPIIQLETVAYIGLKIVHIQSFFYLYFPALGLYTDQKISNTVTFYAHIWSYDNVDAICLMALSKWKNFVCLNTGFLCLLEKHLLRSITKFSLK